MWFEIKNCLIIKRSKKFHTWNSIIKNSLFGNDTWNEHLSHVNYSHYMTCEMHTFHTWTSSHYMTCERHTFHTWKTHIIWHVKCRCCTRKNSHYDMEIHLILQAKNRIFTCTVHVFETRLKHAFRNAKHTWKQAQGSRCWFEMSHFKSRCLAAEHVFEIWETRETNMACVSHFIIDTLRVIHLTSLRACLLLI